MASSGHSLRRQVQWYEDIALKDKSYSASIFYGVQSEGGANGAGAKNAPWAVGYSSLDPNATISHNFSNTNTSALADFATPFIQAGFNFVRGEIDSRKDMTLGLNTGNDAITAIRTAINGQTGGADNLFGEREALSHGPYSEMQISGPLGSLFRTFRQTNINIPVPEISILLSYQDDDREHPFLSYASTMGYGRNSLKYPIDQLKFLLLESISANSIKNNFSIGNLQRESITDHDMGMLNPRGDSEVVSVENPLYSQINEIRGIDEAMSLAREAAKGGIVDWGSYREALLDVKNQMHQIENTVEDFSTILLEEWGCAYLEFDVDVYMETPSEAMRGLEYLEWIKRVQEYVPMTVNRSVEGQPKKIGIVGDSFVTQATVGQLSPYNFRKVNTTEFPAELPGNFSIKYKDVWYKNLILTNIGISFSKEMIPGERISNYGGRVVATSCGPSFIVVRLRFEPAIRQEHRMLMNFLEIGQGVSHTDFNTRRSTVGQIDLVDWVYGMLAEMKNAESGHYNAMWELLKNLFGLGNDSVNAAINALK